MIERDIKEDEVVETVESGDLVEVRERRWVRRRVFTSGYQWRNRTYQHKEVTVVYVIEEDVTIILTAIVRYGRWETVT